MGGGAPLSDQPHCSPSPPWGTATASDSGEGPWSLGLGGNTNETSMKCWMPSNNGKDIKSCALLFPFWLPEVPQVENTSIWGAFSTSGILGVNNNLGVYHLLAQASFRILCGGAEYAVLTSSSPCRCQGARVWLSLPIWHSYIPGRLPATFLEKCRQRHMCDGWTTPPGIILR